MQAQPSDAAAINTLVNSAYRGESSRKGWTTEADMLDGIRTDSDQLKEIIDRKNSVMLVAVNGDDFCGCVHLEKKSFTCHLGMLTVSPTLQNFGLGKEILAASENFAKNEWDCDEINIHVISARKELISWYERRGFELTGDEKLFPMNDPKFGIPKVAEIKFLVMKKSL